MTVLHTIYSVRHRHESVGGKFFELRIKKGDKITDWKTMHVNGKTMITKVKIPDLVLDFCDDYGIDINKQRTNPNYLKKSA